MSDFILNHVAVANTERDGRTALRITMPSTSYQNPAVEALCDRDFMAWQSVNFGNGSIEVEVLSELAPDAPTYARGFIGLAFRIDPAMRFENIYLRPTNSRVDDQVRRNRTIQYAAYPDFTFPRLREEEPGKYETYVDVEMGAWIHLRLEIEGASMAFFVNRSEQPSLIVNHLKLGAEQRGGVGLWIESGTVGHFANLKITNR